MTNENEFDQKLYRLILDFQKAGRELQNRKYATTERQKIKEELYRLVASKRQSSDFQIDSPLSAKG